jgi:general secretion pathway protein D
MRPAASWLLSLMLAAGLVQPGCALSAATPPSGQITLNFVNADIGAVIKAMSEMTGRTFVVDPRVKGTLNITSPRPVRQSVAYDILLATLRMQGYAAVQVDGVVRIIPEADAKFYAVPSKGKTSRTRVGGEMVTRVFTLKHESATQLQVALRPMVGVNSTINAEPASNTLLVTDYADNLARLEQVIEGLDIPAADEPVLIPLKYASAQAIAGLMTRVFTPGAGQAVAGAVYDTLQVGVDERSNSLIVRGRDRSLISKVQNLAASLDVPTPAAGNVHVIYLKNAQAVDIAKTLRNIVNSDASSLTQTQTQAQTQGQNQAQAGQSGKVGQDSGPGMIQADQASNALIITAPEAIFNNLKAVVEKLDVRRAQVLVEALIVEVSADKAAEFGIQWFGATSTNGLAEGSSLGAMFGNSSSTTNLGVLATAGATKEAATGFSIGLFKHKSLGLLARALETEAGGNILSTPTLLTLDNEEAKISVGSNVPFATGSYTTPNTANPNSVSPFTTYERKDVGLTLKVRPQISEAGTVRMQISQEVSQLRQQPGSDATLAATDKRSIDSNVLVDDGQIVVLGGLIQNQMTDGEDSVPVLGDIPLLGHLFRYNSRSQKKTNLMVFLRPQIVRTAAEAAAVTSPRYDYILGQEKASAPAAHPMLPEMKPPMLQKDMWSTNESQGKMALPAETKPAVAASSQAITAQATTTPAPKAPAVDAKPNTPQGDAWWTPKK